MERARILLELCIAYEHVNDRDKYAECFTDLANLHSEMIDASTYQIFRNSVVIRKLANFLYRHKKYNEAKLIKERLEDSVVAGLNRPDDIMYMEDSKVNVLATAEVIFHNGNRLTHCKCYGKYSTLKVLTFRKRVQTFDGKG